MVKIYEVKVQYKLSEEDLKYIRDSIDDYQEGDELMIEDPLDIFYIGEQNIVDASIIANEKAKEFHPDFYNILSVEELSGMRLVNWPEEEDPYYATLDAPPEDIIEFDCTCGYHIKVLDGWTTLGCNECGREIDRSHVIGSNGKYLLIDAGDINSNINQE